MKRTLKKICSLITAFVMLFSLSLNVSAQETNDENKEPTSYQVSYEIYDADGNFVSEGVLPTREQSMLRYNDFPVVTLENGEVMYLKKDGQCFKVGYNVNVTMRFGLNRNANIWAHIREDLSGATLKSWSGFTGGLSISARTTKSVNEIYGIITNGSSDPITVTWASIDF